MLAPLRDAAVDAACRLAERLFKTRKVDGKMLGEAIKHVLTLPQASKIRRFSSIRVSDDAAGLEEFARICRMEADRLGGSADLVVGPEPTQRSVSDPQTTLFAMKA